MNSHQQQLEKILATIGRKAEQDRDDNGYGEKLAEHIQKTLSLLPESYRQRYLNIIYTSIHHPSSFNLGTLIFSELIPQQLGFVPMKHIRNPGVISLKYHDFYLETAQKLASMPDRDSDILEDFGRLLREQGPDKSRKVLRVAMMVKLEDFPDELDNIASFYVGMKSGGRYGGDEGEHWRRVNLVEHKYLGKSLWHPRVFSRATIDEFCSSLAIMQNPRKRRAFLDSVYSEVKRDQLENLDAESVERLMVTLQRYGFNGHAARLEQSMHYRRIRSYDQTIVEHSVKGGIVTHVYETGKTRKLSSLFELKGEPVDEEKMRALISPSMWIGRRKQEVVMSRFARLAGNIGAFIGLPYNQAAKALEVDHHHLDDSVREGYLEVLTHNGVKVIAPTAKYGPTAFAFRSKKSHQRTSSA